MSWLGGTAAASAIATTAALLFTLIFRWMDSRKVDWVTFDAMPEWSLGEGWSSGPHATCSLANTGDADAYRVELHGFGCHVTPQSKSPRSRSAEPVFLLPVVRSGQVVGCDVACDVEVWDVAEVAITWTASPTRFRRFSRRIRFVPLSDISRTPQPMRVTQVDDGMRHSSPIPLAELPAKAPMHPPFRVSRPAQRRWFQSRRWALRVALLGSPELPPW